MFIFYSYHDSQTVVIGHVSKRQIHRFNLSCCTAASKITYKNKKCFPYQIEIMVNSFSSSIFLFLFFFFFSLYFLEIQKNLERSPVSVLKQ